MKIKSLVLIGCAAALVSACASNEKHDHPEQHQMDPQRMEHIYLQFVERWDYNEDGQATCDDVAVKRSRLFKRLDEDKSGDLTSGEFRYAKFEDKSFMFFPLDRVDTNASATIDVDEFVAVSNSSFLHADKDKNCVISEQEAMIAVRELRGGGESGDHSKGGRGGSGGGRSGKGGGHDGPGDGHD